MKGAGRRERSTAGGVGMAVLLVATALVGLVDPSLGSARPGSTPADSTFTMEMLLEKTLFQVDVLTLKVQLRGEAAHRIRELVRTSSLTDSAADSVARLAAHAVRARVRMGFERDVSLSRFLEEVRKSSRAARDAGFISDETYDFIARSLSGWYAFLKGRGLREGDEMVYRIRGDTLGIRYRAADGRLLLDRTDVGAGRRRSVLGGYFAPGSDFREGLISSAFRRDGRRGS